MTTEAIMNGTEAAEPRATSGRAPGAVLAVLLIVIPAATAQVTLHPDEPLARDAATASPFAGIGAGAASSVPLTSDAPAESAATPAYITWERWWHLRLYGEVAARAPAAGKVDAVLHEDVVAVLAEALEGGSDLERSAAAVALGRADMPGAVADLVFALEDATPEVQQSIVLALGMTGRERARPLLQALALDARYGRRSIGRRTDPVPLAVRAAAVVGLGHLAPRRDDTTLRDLIVAPATPVDLRLAACIAAGLRPVAEAPSTRRVRGPSECERHAEELAVVLADGNVASECRAALLLSLARVTPFDARLAKTACAWLGATDARLARAAASACALLKQRSPETVTALWKRVADPVDMVASGMALMALAADADDVTFARLARLEDLPRALLPYAAFGLLDASGDDADRIETSRRALSCWMASTTDRGVGAACVVLGLFGAQEDTGRLSQLVSRRVSARARGAAILGLGLLGQDARDDAAADIADGGRTTSFELHDSVISAALARRDSAELIEVMRGTRDDYVLGGCARALALCGDTAAAGALLEVLEEEDDEHVRAFAVGALGLMLDRERRFGLERLRDVSPLPVSSRPLMRVLAHL